MSRADYYINLLKSKILLDEDIIEICKEFKLETPNFNNSHDWIFGLMSRKVLDKREEQKLKVYLNKFLINNGLDYKKLGRQINLSGTKDDRSLEGWSDIILGNKVNNSKKDRLMEGHRLIRNFQREREKNEEIVDFEWKELQLIKKQLSESINDLKKEFARNEDNSEKQYDIFGDVGMLKHYITNIENIERGFKKISEKYGWDK